MSDVITLEALWKAREALTANASPDTHVVYIHLDMEADFRAATCGITDPVNLGMQQKIRRAIRANERKRAQSGKSRGIKWLRSKQAQCAIIGHVPLPNKTRCMYCGADTK